MAHITSRVQADGLICTREASSGSVQPQLVARTQQLERRLQSQPIPAVLLAAYDYYSSFVTVK